MCVCLQNCERDYFLDNARNTTATELCQNNNYMDVLIFDPRVIKNRQIREVTSRLHLLPYSLTLTPPPLYTYAHTHKRRHTHTLTGS